MSRSKRQPASRPTPVARSRRHSGFARVQQGLSAWWGRLLERPLLWVMLLLMLGTWSLMPRGLGGIVRVKPGTIAGRDYVARQGLLIPDEETTEEKRQRAREEVLPVYDLDPGVVEDLDRQLQALFAEGRTILSEEAGAEQQREPEEVLTRLQAVASLKLGSEQVAVLTKHGFSNELEDRLRGLFGHILQRGVVASKAQLLENRMRGVTLRDLKSGEERLHVDLFGHLDYPEELVAFVEAEVRDWTDLPRRERRELTTFVSDNIPPNMHFNRSETSNRREAAAQATKPVFQQIRKGQIIVRKGDEIDAGAARLIATMTDRPLRDRLLPGLGRFLIMSLATLGLWLGLKRERVWDHSRRRVFAEAALLLLLTLVLLKFSVRLTSGLAASFDSAPLSSSDSYLYAIPFASMALVVGLLFGRNLAVTLGFLFSLLVGLVVEHDALSLVIYSIAGTLTAVYALEEYQIKQRLALMRVGVAVGLVNMLTIVILNALAGGTEASLAVTGFQLLCGVVGGFLVAAVASFAVPILEPLLSVTTDIKLIELSNTNLPLLRRLAFEAPGTFQHSLMVANLSKEGCEAIGADPVLAYTGALYHDIGKLLRPDYFIENQHMGHNPHEKLAASMSALILINHVKEGLQLARNHHLPKPIQDAIAQHHGTHLIKYFYSRAVEKTDPAAGAVQEEDYRYPGPKPQNRVMGVLMLADAVEAASRTLQEPSPVKVRTMIRQIFDNLLQDGQLDETDLTLADLRRVFDAFARVLSNIFHRRVDYPGFDFKSAEVKQGKRAANL